MISETDHRHLTPIALNAPLIEIRDVSVFRETTLILDHISLSIPRFRHTAILGPNGSGKSSLTKLLMRHFYPSVESDGHQGTVSILGQSDWEVGQLWRRMGMVTPTLDHEFSGTRTGRMTVVEAVASGFTATQLREYGPKITGELADAVDAAIDVVGMQSMRHRVLRTLSTGERRRVMIARATVHQPDIFVLDEPTSGLDLVARDEFLQILDRLTHHRETTIVLVTHHVQEIPPAMDHVILLDGGKVEFDGPKTEGLGSERLSTLFGRPLLITADPQGWYSAQLAK